MRISYKVESEEYREFFQHPGWRHVLHALDEMLEDLVQRAARERKDHEYKVGVLDGATMVVTRLRGAVENKKL